MVKAGLTPAFLRFAKTLIFLLICWAYDIRQLVPFSWLAAADHVDLGQPAQEDPLQLGWMGVRGVGSMYYLAFVLTHDLELDPLSDQITQVVLFTVAASVVLHGISATPIMTLYKSRKRRRKGQNEIS